MNYKITYRLSGEIKRKSELVSADELESKIIELEHAKEKFVRVAK